MPAWSIILLSVFGVLLVGLIVLGIIGRKRQKKADEAFNQLRATAQTVSILVIDKKRIRFEDAGYPKSVMDQTPKMMRKIKVPAVKAKVGPKVYTLICYDPKVYDLIPVKKEVKAVINSIYILDVKGLRGSLDTAPKKKGLFGRLKKN